MPYIGKKPADIIATVIDTTTGTFSGEVDAGSLDVSGNADIDGITNLDNTDIDGTLNVQGETTLQTHLNMGDNDIIKLGDSADLQIYHTGADSLIAEAGTGRLKIQSNGLGIDLSSTTGELMLRARTDNDVQLYYDAGTYSDPKLATTSTGIDVTGTATMDGLTVDGDTKISSTQPYILFDETDTTDQNVRLRLASGSLYLQNTDNSGTFLKQIARLDTNNDISFYEDTGTTAKFFWDASAERLGIGTTSPGSNIEIEDTSSDVVLRMVSSATSQSAIYLGDANFRSRARLIYDNSDETFQIWGGSGTGSAQRITLDSSGNLLVGKTSSNLSTAGSEFASDGLVRFTRSNVNAVVNFNKLNNEGDIVVFRKDDALVGSIGVTSTDNVFLSGNSSHAGIMAGTSAIAPFKNGVLVDNGIDFGTNNYRWKDLYLSGGVYVGGTGSANFLSDYEEGTFTVTLRGGTTTGAFNYTDRTAHYIKIGDLVTVSVEIAATTSSPAPVGQLEVAGLPFTCDRIATGTFQCNDMGSNYDTNVAQYTAIIQSGNAHIHFRGTKDNNTNFATLQAQSMSFLRTTITYKAQ